MALGRTEEIYFCGQIELGRDILSMMEAMAIPGPKIKSAVMSKERRVISNFFN